MRPTDTSTEIELYECYSCGARAKEPDARVCGDCGGTLQNISRGRDF